MDDSDPSNSMLDEEQPKAKKASFFGFNYGQTASKDNDTKSVDDQNGFETVVRELPAEDPPQTYDAPVSNRSDPEMGSTYRPYNDLCDNQNGYETVIKLNEINQDVPRGSYDDAHGSYDDGQNGYEAVWKGDIGMEVEQSFSSKDSKERSPARVFSTEEELPPASNLMRTDSNIEEPYEENETYMRITKAIRNVVDERNDTNSKSKKKCLALICIFCLLIVLCVILGVYLSGSTDKDDITTTDDPNLGAAEDIPTSTTAPDSPALQLPDETWDAIENDPTGPQAKAFDWFWNDYDKHADYSSQRMLQRFALATLYYATGGDFWANNSGWLSEEHECQWFSSVSFQPQYYEQGVTSCQSGSDTITSLVLIDNNLTANSLPDELYLLSNVRQIDLQMNNIRGPLSPSVGKLNKLARLRLGRNEMTGKIPEEIASLSFLQVLSLYNNKFNGPIPGSIGQAQELIQIWLSNNQLTGTITTVIGQLTELQVAWMDQNKFDGGIPSEIGSLPQLQDLMLHENRLVGSLPTEFGLLGDYLINLDLRSNRLSGLIPSEIGMMTRLNSLVLHENKFSGQLPSEIGLMARIETMYISSNELTGTIPTTIGDCRNLSILWLNSNSQLTGTIPSELGKLSDAKDVFLSRDALYGTLPSEIGLMVGLRTLALEQNVGLTGTLPTELAQLRGLSKITITRTGISGTIPDEICQVHEDALRFDCTASLCGCGDCPC